MQAAEIAPPIPAHPILLLDPTEVPALRARLTTGTTKPAPLLQALLTGTPEERRRVALAVVERIRQTCSLDKGPLPPDPPVAYSRRCAEGAYHLDIALGLGALHPEEIADARQRLLTSAARVALTTPPRDTGNRPLDQAVAAGLVGLLFPEDPRSAAWVDAAVAQTRHVLDHGVWEGGAKDEVPRYHDWTVRILAGWVKALHRRKGIDLYDHPGMRGLLDWYVRFQSPPVRLPGLPPQGLPTLPAWGDSNYGLNGSILALYAPAYAERDPAFARRLMWAWRQAGSPALTGWQFDLIAPLLQDPSLADAPQHLSTAFCRTPGYALLRGGNEDPDETAVFFRGGRRSLHPRADLGSFDLFARGVPLVLGAQSGRYGSPEHEQWHRNAEASNVVMVGAASRPRTDHGRIIAFAVRPAADYVAADLSGRTADGAAYTWERHLLFLRPDTLVVWDHLQSPQDARWLLHTTATTFTWEPHRVVGHTPWGVDLTMDVLAPAAALVPDVREGRFGDWDPQDPRRKKSDPYPFTTLQYLSLPIPAGQDAVVVLRSGRDARSLPLKWDPQEHRLTFGTTTITLAATGITLADGGQSPQLLPRAVEANAR